MSLKRAERIGLAFSLKLSALHALFFFIASVGLFIVAYYGIDALLDQAEHDIIQDRMREYRAWFQEEGIDALRKRFDEQSNTDRNAFFVRITDQRNEALFISVPLGSGVFDTALLDQRAPRQQEPWAAMVELGENNIWAIASAPLQGGLTLQVGKSSAQNQALLSYFRTVFIGILLPMLLIGIVGGEEECR